VAVLKQNLCQRKEFFYFLMLNYCINELFALMPPILSLSVAQKHPITLQHLPISGCEIERGQFS
jgi:hypothetical protein